MGLGSAKILTSFLIEVCSLKCQCCDECGVVLQFDRSGNCHCKEEKLDGKEQKYGKNFIKIWI